MAESRELAGKSGVFATRFLEVLKERGKTQKWVAEQTHTKGQSISQYANGKVLPNIEILYEIAKCLDVSADYLLGLQDVKSGDLDTQQIHTKLGLSEETITLLALQMEYLYNLTNTQTPQAAFDKFNKIQRDMIFEHPLEEFRDVAKGRNFNVEEVDRGGIYTQTFVPYSYILNRFLGNGNLKSLDAGEGATLGELYDLMMFLQTHYTNFSPIPYTDPDDILSIHIVRLQRAFLSWINSQWGTEGDEE